MSKSTGVFVTLAKRQPTVAVASVVLLMTELTVPLKPKVTRMVVLVTSLLLFLFVRITSSRRGDEPKNSVKLTTNASNVAAVRPLGNRKINNSLYKVTLRDSVVAVFVPYRLASSLFMTLLIITLRLVSITSTGITAVDYLLAPRNYGDMQSY